MKCQKKEGFSFPELLVAVGILSVIVVGMIQVFVSSSVLGELSQNSVSAFDQMVSKFEEIRHTNLDDLEAIYGVGGSEGATFAIDLPPGMGLISLDTSNPDLVQISIQMSYRNKYGRITGEDSNLNGVLDVGEDQNGNGVLDSPLTLSTVIAKR